MVHSEVIGRSDLLILGSDEFARARNPAPLVDHQSLLITVTAGKLHSTSPEMHIKQRQTSLSCIRFPNSLDVPRSIPHAQKKRLPLGLEYRLYEIPCTLSILM